MLRKFTTIVAMLVLLTLLATPMVLAQTQNPPSSAPNDLDPSLVFAPDEADGLRYVVGCYDDQYGNPTALCAVDDDGFVLLDGAIVPASAMSHPVYDLYTGDIAEFVDGEPVTVEP